MIMTLPDSLDIIRGWLEKLWLAFHRLFFYIFLLDVQVFIIWYYNKVRHSGRAEAETRNPGSGLEPLDSDLRRNDEEFQRSRALTVLFFKILWL
jgi:hypothetical protein